MKHGVAMFVTDDGLDIVELARTAEELGFESLFVPEHTHIPASRRSHPGDAGRSLGEEYSRTLDPFVALAVAAAVTTRLRLATGICLVVERDPITTAKEVATLDLLSGGRFLFGVGAGWNREEMRNHGTDPRTRMALMGERVKAMKAIWTEDEASFHGQFVGFDRIWAWPKPAQRPHPPVMIGGTGPTVTDRVLDFGDEWLPEPEPGLLERIVELQRRARASGRPDGVPVTMMGADPADSDKYARAGIHRVVHWLPPRDAAAARARLHQLAGELDLRPLAAPR